MQQNWIQRSENTLNQIRKLLEKPDQDRLELVRVMRFVLNALGMSLGGWMQWINSPEVMSRFTEKELNEMVNTITDMVTKFIDYDIKISNLGVDKGLAKQRSSRRREMRFII